MKNVNGSESSLKEVDSKFEKAEEFYKNRWNIKISDEIGYTTKYRHMPIEMIKFAENYHQFRLVEIEMSGTLKFKLPEDRTEFNAACKATDLTIALFKIESYGRYLQNKDDREAIPSQEVADKLFDIIAEYSINIDDILE